jgi:ABC-2 type transport system permease protein
VRYPIDVVPPKAKFIFGLNPVTPIIEANRNIFYDGKWPQWDVLGYLTVGLLILVIISLVVFGRFQKTVAEEI